MLAKTSAKSSLHNVLFSGDTTWWITQWCGATMPDNHKVIFLGRRSHFRKVKPHRSKATHKKMIIIHKYHYIHSITLLHNWIHTRETRQTHKYTNKLTEEKRFFGAEKRKEQSVHNIWREKSRIYNAPVMRVFMCHMANTNAVFLPLWCYCCTHWRKKENLYGINQHR